MPLLAGGAMSQTISLDPPSNFSVTFAAPDTNSASHYFVLSWDSVSNALGYELSYWTQTDGTVSVSVGNTTSHSFYNVCAPINEAYVFYVRGVRMGVKSSYTDAAYRTGSTADGNNCATTLDLFESDFLTPPENFSVIIEEITQNIYDDNGNLIGTEQVKVLTFKWDPVTATGYEIAIPFRNNFIRIAISGGETSYYQYDLSESEPCLSTNTLVEFRIKALFLAIYESRDARRVYLTGSTTDDAGCAITLNDDDSSIVFDSGSTTVRGELDFNTTKYWHFSAEAGDKISIVLELQRANEKHFDIRLLDDKRGVPLKAPAKNDFMISGNGAGVVYAGRYAVMHDFPAPYTGTYYIHLRSLVRPFGENFVLTLGKGNLDSPGDSPALTVDGDCHSDEGLGFYTFSYDADEVTSNFVGNRLGVIGAGSAHFYVTLHPDKNLVDNIVKIGAFFDKFLKVKKYGGLAAGKVAQNKAILNYLGPVAQRVAQPVKQLLVLLRPVAAKIGLTGVSIPIVTSIPAAPILQPIAPATRLVAKVLAIIYLADIGNEAITTGFGRLPYQSTLTDFGGIYSFLSSLTTIGPGKKFDHEFEVYGGARGGVIFTVYKKHISGGTFEYSVSILCNLGASPQDPKVETEQAPAASVSARSQSQSQSMTTGERINADTTAGIRVAAASGLRSGIQFERRDASALVMVRAQNIETVLQAGPVEIIDVWGYADQPTDICFENSRIPAGGGIIFIDKSGSQPTVDLSPAISGNENETCAHPNRHGLVVLVTTLPAGSAPQIITISASLPQGTPILNPNCLARLTNIVNFREGPGTEYESITVLPSNIRLTGLEKTDSWIKVDNHGTQGWISRDLVIEEDCDDGPAEEPLPKATAWPYPTPTLAPVVGQPVTNCSVKLLYALNFRARPGYGSEILRELPYNVVLTGVERVEGWFKVDWYGERGWVSADYVEPSPGCLAAVGTPEPVGITPVGRR